MQLRAVTLNDLADIETAIAYLKRGRNLLRQAKAKKSADYVAKAVKSAEGALRHADRCAFRLEKKGGNA